MHLSRALRAMQLGITVQLSYVGSRPGGTMPALRVYAPLSSTSVLFSIAVADFLEPFGGIFGVVLKGYCQVDMFATTSVPERSVINETTPAHVWCLANERAYFYFSHKIAQLKSKTTFHLKHFLDFVF